MAVRSSIFGSKGEEHGFRSIERTWSNDYRVYPQFSFSDLFEPDEGIRDTSNFFYKTSVDYVLCTSEGKPLLVIDFDGMGRGFNKRGEYVQVEPTTDPYRKWKFDFKIKYAKKHGLPYYVVSSQEFEHVDRDSTLTIVDGLIGTELARRDVLEQFPVVLEDQRHMIEGLLPHERQEYIQDLFISQEIESDFAHNRISQRTEEIRYSLANLVGWNRGRWDSKPLEEPALPQFDGTKESLETRMAAFDRVGRVGSECTLFDTPVGDISATAWMRDIGDYSPGRSITRELAELLGWSKLARLLHSSKATQT